MPPKGSQDNWHSREGSISESPGPPEGSKILEKSSHAGYKLQTADWRLETGCWGSNTPRVRRISITPPTNFENMENHEHSKKPNGKEGTEQL